MNTSTKTTNPVILNSFQDPSSRHIWRSRRVHKLTKLRRCATSSTVGQNEKWVLKQVQDDEKGKGRAA